MLQFKFWLVNFQEIKIDFKKRTAAVKIWTEMNLYVVYTNYTTYCSDRDADLQIGWTEIIPEKWIKRTQLEQNLLFQSNFWKLPQPIERSSKSQPEILCKMKKILFIKLDCSRNSIPKNNRISVNPWPTYPTPVTCLMVAVGSSIAL